ncbi:hypothetical protein BD626DRAFT_504804 [Schizophyllum amplum]|uniref:Uncharacterized protein n=1 Tax=Schizophyllum amplum TaxID=97359 RepID=A0A550C787_9AGAR|nr:hypothetical protein BD626DRAFT_504804 [Auriculariopsis ampla]
MTPSSAVQHLQPPPQANIHELNLFAGNLFLRDEASGRLWICGARDKASGLRTSDKCCMATRWRTMSSRAASDRY